MSMRDASSAYPLPCIPPSLAPSLPSQAFALDAASFKDKWKGVFATLTFKDANNELLHVATVVSAKSEDGAECYSYLLAQAMKSPRLRDVLNNPNTTCFTDKPKGSDEPAVHKVCPLTEDRRCVAHLLKLLGSVGPVSLTRFCIFIILFPFVFSALFLIIPSYLEV